MFLSSVSLQTVTYLYCRLNGQNSSDFLTILSVAYFIKLQAFYHAQTRKLSSTFMILVKSNACKQNKNVRVCHNLDLLLSSFPVKQPFF